VISGQWSVQKRTGIARKDIEGVRRTAWQGAVTIVGSLTRPQGWNSIYTRKNSIEVRQLSIYLLGIIRMGREGVEKKGPSARDTRSG